jgi:hypothetical protein
MKQKIVDRIIVPQCILMIILVGFFGFFLGHTTFVDSDSAYLLQENIVNNKWGGWRPDITFGVSAFFSDPGTTHPRNLFSLWLLLFDNKVLGHNILFIMLVWVACLSQYIFLRKLVPEVNKTVLVCLAALIPFSSMRYEFVFLYANIIQITSASLGSLLFYEFFKAPRIRHYFYYIMLIWALVFLGSSVSLFQFLFFSALFTFGVIAYHGWYSDWTQLRYVISRYFSVNLIAGSALFFLGAWVFFCLWVEQVAVGYSRTPDYTTSSFVRSPELLETILKVSQYFHAGYLSPWSGELGIRQRLGGQSWQNISPITPVLILIFLFFKSQNFWEFSAKYIVLGGYLYHEIFYWFPGPFNFIQSMVKLYPPDKMYPFIQVYQIVLVAFLVSRLTSTNNEPMNTSQWKTPRVLAFVLALFYGGGLVFILFLKTVPQVLLEYSLEMLRWVGKVFDFGVEFLAVLLEANILLLDETLTGSSILFYGFTFFLLLIFSTRSWPRFIGFMDGRILAIALLLNGLFLSWAVYPLNKQPLQWDQQKVGGVPLAARFEPTDRLARVGSLPACRGKEGYQECVQKKFFDNEFGPRRYQVGRQRVPLFEFTKVQSFAPQPSIDYINSFMRQESLVSAASHGTLRALMDERLSYSSKLFDLAAINYLWSRDRLPDTKHLELIYKSRQFFLYFNKRAWPYYYFADRIETIGAYENLYEAEQGTAYLWEGADKVTLPIKPPIRKRRLTLEKFEHGDVEFIYSSDEQEFLVIADSWHPNWLASVNGEEVPILKVNGIFKGILLPPGDGRVHLIFNNTPYSFGILVSAVSWSLFLLGWGWCAFRLRERY